MPQPPLILIVDDEAPLREVFAEALETEGYTVLTADNGQRALDLLRQAKPDAVVLDLMLPVLDGWAFIENYRAVAGTEVPIISISAALTPAASDRLGALGVRVCLAKPFDIADLIDCVGQLTRVPEAVVQ